MRWHYQDMTAHDLWMPYKFTRLAAGALDYEDAVEWCWEYLGPECGAWRSVPALDIIWIRDANSAFAFRMRWC